MFALPSVLFALCAAAAPPSKPAETVGVLAVSPPPGPSPELIEVTGKLRDELAKRLDGVLGGRALKERMAEPPTASLSDLDRAFSSAIEGSKRDPALAISWLHDIIAELEHKCGGPEEFTQWTRANLRLARMRLEFANPAEPAESGAAEARLLVERTLRLQPELKLDANLYPKRLMALVDEVRASLSKSPMRSLSVKSPNEGTQVLVDGKVVGTAPVSLQVPSGVYRVCGSQGALRTPAVFADLRDKERPVTLDFSLASTFRPTQGPGLAAPDAEQEARVAQSATALGLDRIVTASIVEQRIPYFVASAMQAKPGGAPPRQGWLRLSLGGLPADAAQQMAEFLVTGQAKGGIATSPPEGEKASFSSTSALDLRVKPPTEEAAHCAAEPLPIGSPILRWSPVVTAGATLALGAVSAWQASRSNAKFESASALWATRPLSAPTYGTYNKYLSEGQSAKSLGIGLGVGAGVALASTAVLGYLGYRQSHEIGPFRF